MRMLQLQQYQRATALQLLAAAKSSSSKMSRTTTAIRAASSFSRAATSAPQKSSIAPTTTTKSFLASSSFTAVDNNVGGVAAATTNNTPTLAKPASFNYCRRSFSTATTGADVDDNDDNDNYHVEVSNLYGGGGCKSSSANTSSSNNNNYTQIVITGKGVPGLLASICTAITIKGGSIKELHAADDMKEGGLSTPNNDDDDNNEHIKDIIYVVDRSTGQAFKDDDLEELGYAVLRYTSNPMAVVQAVCDETEKLVLGSTNTNSTTNKGGGNVTVLPAHKFPAL